MLMLLSVANAFLEMVALRVQASSGGSLSLGVLLLGMIPSQRGQDARTAVPDQRSA